uniref:Uncharacterized protein n=1 Tax=Klebsiella pneumoniae TaxID=573 RepID=A0A2P1BNM0_KLEPN|nr:hypothetical protein [Klebsiella pneumoniae]
MYSHTAWINLRNHIDCGTGLCRADTTARRKAEDAGRHRRPQRRYSAKLVWTVFERNLSEKTTGRTASIIKPATGRGWRRQRTLASAAAGLK